MNKGLESAHRWAGPRAGTAASDGLQRTRGIASTARAAPMTSWREPDLPKAHRRFVALAQWGDAPAARHVRRLADIGHGLPGEGVDGLGVGAPTRT